MTRSFQRDLSERHLSEPTLQSRLCSHPSELPFVANLLSHPSEPPFGAVLRSHPVDTRLGLGLMDILKAPCRCESVAWRLRNGTHRMRTRGGFYTT